MSVTLNGTVYDESGFIANGGYGYVDLFPTPIFTDFLAECQTQIENVAAGISATSTTSVAIGTGSKSLTIETLKSFVAGQWVAIYYDSSNYMVGSVTSYDGSTGALVVSVPTDFAVGVGTYASWSVNLAAPPLPETVHGINFVTSPTVPAPSPLDDSTTVPNTAWVNDECARKIGFSNKTNWQDNEQVTITLDDALANTAEVVVDVYEEVPQTGVTNGFWDFSLNAGLFDRFDAAFAETLTLSATAVGEATATLASSSWAAKNRGCVIEEVGGTGKALVLSVSATVANVLITNAFTTSPLASGNWALYGQTDTDDGLRAYGAFDPANVTEVVGSTTGTKANTDPNNWVKLNDTEIGYFYVNGTAINAEVWDVTSGAVTKVGTYKTGLSSVLGAQTNFRAVRLAENVVLFCGVVRSQLTIQIATWTPSTGFATNSYIYGWTGTSSITYCQPGIIDNKVVVAFSDANNDCSFVLADVSDKDNIFKLSGVLDVGLPVKIGGLLNSSLSVNLDEQNNIILFSIYNNLLANGVTIAALEVRDSALFVKDYFSVSPDNYDLSSGTRVRIERFRDGLAVLTWGKTSASGYGVYAKAISYDNATGKMTLGAETTIATAATTLNHILDNINNDFIVCISDGGGSTACQVTIIFANSDGALVPYDESQIAGKATTYLTVKHMVDGIFFDTRQAVSAGPAYQNAFVLPLRVPATDYYPAISSEAGAIDTAFYIDINGLTVSATDLRETGVGVAFYAAFAVDATFDSSGTLDGGTFITYDSTATAWRNIATSLAAVHGGAEGSWYYNSGATGVETWAACLGSTALEAINEALVNNSVNRMTGNTLSGLGDADFFTLGGSLAVAVFVKAVVQSHGGVVESFSLDYDGNVLNQRVTENYTIDIPATNKVRLTAPASGGPRNARVVAFG